MGRKGQGSSMTLGGQIHGRNPNKVVGGGGGGGGGNVRSILKMQHLQKLASWAGGEASIPSLGALFGQRLASTGESLGIPLDPSLFTCERCESILQPGDNCTVRIEKNRSKTKRRHKKSSIPPKNNVVYTCHFCSHRNVKRGTPKHHMKDILSSKPKRVAEFKKVCSDQKYSSSAKAFVSNGEIGNSSEQTCLSSAKIITNGIEIGKNVEEVSSSKLVSLIESEVVVPEMNPATATDIPVEKSPATPVEKIRINLSENRRKRSKSGCKKQVGTESNSATMDAEKATGGSTKRKRKSWTSLKEIAEKNERKNIDIANLTIPFLL